MYHNGGSRDSFIKLVTDIPPIHLWFARPQAASMNNNLGELLTFTTKLHLCFASSRLHHQTFDEPCVFQNSSSTAICSLLDSSTKLLACCYLLLAHQPPSCLHTQYPSAQASSTNYDITYERQGRFFITALATAVSQQNALLQRHCGQRSC